jgi:hypothetical protein
MLTLDSAAATTRYYHYSSIRQGHYCFAYEIITFSIVFRLESAQYTLSPGTCMLYVVVPSSASVVIVIAPLCNCARSSRANASLHGEPVPNFILSVS